MNQYYYTLDGKVARGPISEKDLRYLLADGVVNQDTVISIHGTAQWTYVKDIEDLNPPYKKRKRDEEPLDPETLKRRRLKEEEILNVIKMDLDRFWEAQRESIICRIQEEDLDEEYITLRKKPDDLIDRVVNDTLQFWRISGQLESWIRQMVWKGHDFMLPISGTVENKFAQITEELRTRQMHDEAGCYVYYRSGKALYVGEADKLIKRVDQHKQKIFAAEADQFRFIIPAKAPQRKRMERMLILLLEPQENKNEGTGKTARKNPADEILDFIREEIKELQTDAE